jgi:hypothetical protein
LHHKNGDAIAAGANSAACIPELKRLIAQARADGAAADPEQRPSGVASE